MPSSRGSSQPKDRTQVSLIAGRFFTVWATRETKEYWSGQPVPSAGEPPDPGIQPGPPALQVDSSPASNQGSPYICVCQARIPTPVFLTGEFHGQRSLMGYSPWGHKESDMTEQITHTHTRARMGNTSMCTYICVYIYMYIYIYILYVLCIYNILQCKIDLRIKISSSYSPEPLAKDQLKNH